MSEVPSSAAEQQNFTQFSSLPTELRLMIWKQSITSQLSPRIHSILPTRRESSNFVSNQPISNLLHICHESRDLYLTLTKTNFAYGTYINFDIDTLYLADCPTPSKSAYSVGFEACKELGRSDELVGKVKRLAMKDTFWLRPNTITCSIAVDAWNMVIKGNMHALEELLIVFGDQRGLEQKRELVRFETIGSYHRAPESSVGQRERRCDEFLPMYLGYFPAERRCMRQVIKYVVVDGTGEGNSC